MIFPHEAYILVEFKWKKKKKEKIRLLVYYKVMNTLEDKTPKVE